MESFGWQGKRKLFFIYFDFFARCHIVSRDWICAVNGQSQHVRAPGGKIDQKEKIIISETQNHKKKSSVSVDMPSDFFPHECFWFAPHHGTWLDFFGFNVLPLCVSHCMKSTEFENISMIVEIRDKGERTVGGDCRVIKKKRVKFAWWFTAVVTADSNKNKVDIAMQDFRYHMKESRPSTRFNIAVLHVDYSVLSQQENNHMSRHSSTLHPSLCT